MGGFWWRRLRKFSTTMLRWIRVVALIAVACVDSAQALRVGATCTDGGALNSCFGGQDPGTVAPMIDNISCYVIVSLQACLASCTAPGDIALAQQSAAFINPKLASAECGGVGAGNTGTSTTSPIRAGNPSVTGTAMPGVPSSIASAVSATSSDSNPMPTPPTGQKGGLDPCTKCFTSAARPATNDKIALCNYANTLITCYAKNCQNAQASVQTTYNQAKDYFKKAGCGSGADTFAPISGLVLVSLAAVFAL